MMTLIAPVRTGYHYLTFTDIIIYFVSYLSYVFFFRTDLPQYHTHSNVHTLPVYKNNGYLSELMIFESTGGTNVLLVRFNRYR
jgi:hypothetical protein